MKKKFLLYLALSLSLITIIFTPVFDVKAADTAETARPSVNGALHVDGAQLVDEDGSAVQLRGVSMHGLTWYPQFIDGSFFGQLSDDWNCSLVRLPMYSEIYCESAKSRDLSFSLLKKGIDLAIASDMYVMADWHILEDSDPNIHIKEAVEFFDAISSEYAGVPNIIYEICNEPNGETGWSDVAAYSDTVIPVIRKNDPDAVILIGTPEYDRNLGSSLLRPLGYDNLMYVLHFYAASHDEGLREELCSAVDAGLPVFISECGISEATGDGDIDFESAVQWFSCLDERKISYAVWSASDKAEASAFFKPGFDPAGKIEDEDLTVCGQWIRELIRGTDPAAIPYPEAFVGQDTFSRISQWIIRSIGGRGFAAVSEWWRFARISVALFVITCLIGTLAARRQRTITYDDIRKPGKRFSPFSLNPREFFTRAFLILSIHLTMIYLGWRIVYSVPVEAGIAAVAANILLLAVEILGFMESLVFCISLLKLREHPLPKIPEEAYPDVDIFIATYNEPVDLLRRTVNGCVHIKYPDRSKVHIYICDDNRRPQMRELAKEMGVGYFDRPDNKGAKAGNLNHALGLTSSPYVVTLDADMIPKSDFLLKTIPYFVDAELRNKGLPEGDQIQLGLLQTPQSFYDPDVFQHALYSEKRAPNEQDFFYRTIEPAKTSTNSVIYGGSNTVLSRAALEKIGGFYTESITEDFATGLLIESNGFVSLGLPEPLASGQTPHTYKEHIQQRTRWARGVIVTAKKLKIWRRKGLTFVQKASYWSSVTYWYSPIKNLIYILSPLWFAVFAVPVFKCNWLELMVYWLPMFFVQDLCLKLCSRRTISNKWSGIYETGVMPHLLIPVLKESVGISLTSFKVTDKSQQAKRGGDLRTMAPFIILVALSLAGIARLISIFSLMQSISLGILLFWIIRNLYFLILSLFLVDGRDSDTEPVKVVDAVPVIVKVKAGLDGRLGQPGQPEQEGPRKQDGSPGQPAGRSDQPGQPAGQSEQPGPRQYEGVTTMLTEHNMTVFLDDGDSLGIGARVEVCLDDNDHRANMTGVVTSLHEAKRSRARTHTIEILDFGNDWYEYLEHLYDRVPTLPQSLQRDFGIIAHLWQNIAHRVARTRK